MEPEQANDAVEVSTLAAQQHKEDYLRYRCRSQAIGFTAINAAFSLQAIINCRRRIETAQERKKRAPHHPR